MRALDRLLELHRPYLTRLIQARIDPSMVARVDASDVVQEAQIIISERIADFISQRPTSFRLWIRGKTLEQLIQQRRRHIGAQKRSVLLEQSMTDVSSLAIARNLLSSSPSRQLRKVELHQQVVALIDELSENDKAILSLRHIEALSNSEVADLLEMTPNTARQRYGRALRRLHQLLASHNIVLDETGA